MESRKLSRLTSGRPTREQLAARKQQREEFKEKAGFVYNTPPDNVPVQRDEWGRLQVNLEFHKRILGTPHNGIDLPMYKRRLAVVRLLDSPYQR